jgi:hypothetical protein
MIVIGADYHPGFQQIAFVDTETGDCGERRLQHREEAEKFYRDLAAQGRKVRVGMEASGHARWFERLLSELTFELWIGDAAEIRARRVRKQKTDRQDAQHILRLLVEDRFPQTQFQKLLDHRGIVGNFVTGALAKGPMMFPGVGFSFHEVFVTQVCWQCTATPQQKRKTGMAQWPKSGLAWPTSAAMFPRLPFRICEANHNRK